MDVVKPIYSLIKCSDNYSNTSGNLYQFFRDEPNNDIIDSESIKFKPKFLDNTKAERWKNVINAEIAVVLKYLSNFWRTLEMPWVNCEIDLVITWSAIV